MAQVPRSQHLGAIRAAQCCSRCARSSWRRMKVTIVSRFAAVIASTSVCTWGPQVLQYPFTSYHFTKGVEAQPPTTGCRSIMWHIGVGACSRSEVCILYLRWSLSVTEHITCIQSLKNVRYSYPASRNLSQRNHWVTMRSKWLDGVQRPHRK